MMKEMLKDCKATYIKLSERNIDHELLRFAKLNGNELEFIPENYNDFENKYLDDPITSMKFPTILRNYTKDMKKAIESTE